MLVRDLYELRPGQHASAVFAALAAFAGAPPLDDVRALFAEVDAARGRGARRARPRRSRARRRSPATSSRACARWRRTPMKARPRRPKLLLVDDGDRYAELLHRFCATTTT